MSEKRRTSPQTRRAFHMGRIRGARNGVARFFLAAAWAASELKVLARRDPAKAHEQGGVLAEQLIKFAGDLNDRHHALLKGGKTHA